MSSVTSEIGGVEGWRHSWGAAAIGRPGHASRRPLPVRDPGRRTLAPAGAAEGVFTVREFTVPLHRRIAESVAQAAIVRDVAAFGAVVLFGTMLALVLGGDPFL